jgi:hypothetical protein
MFREYARRLTGDGREMRAENNDRLIVKTRVKTRVENA